jgi:enterochelin esterase family protein
MVYKTFLFITAFCLGSHFFGVAQSLFSQKLQAWQAYILKASPTEWESFWQERIKAKEIPLVIGDSVAFFYKGEAQSVAWAGDFSGWNPEDKLYQGVRIGSTPFWFCKAKFPVDARLDYKIVINNNDWVVDAANPYQQWSGAGGGQPNSELRMSGWQAEKWTFPQENISKGTMMTYQFESKKLSYRLQYSVYLPVGYEKLSKLPVIYVTDGHEYSDARMGAVVTVLDNLIAANKIEPVIAVFIDPRQPDKLENNRRADEFLGNEKYKDFVTQELIAHIDKTYKTQATAEARVIVGTSFGGFCATYFALNATNYFGNVVINSPAYWYDTDLLTKFLTTPKLPIKKIFFSNGTISDGEKLSRLMQAILKEKKYNCRIVEVNEGHSWGNWRALVDDWLLYLFGK